MALPNRLSVGTCEDVSQALTLSEMVVALLGTVLEICSINEVVVVVVMVLMPLLFLADKDAANVCVITGAVVFVFAFAEFTKFGCVLVTFIVTDGGGGALFASLACSRVYNSFGAGRRSATAGLPAMIDEVRMLLRASLSGDRTN